MPYDIFIAPFSEFEFMRRALAGVLALALGAGPIGVFLMLRRMSLVGDAMAHAILPGAAVGFLLSGLNLFAMTFGGLIAGFTVAILGETDRKSTRLNSSHLGISYAVFCLKKKNQTEQHRDSEQATVKVVIDIPAVKLVTICASRRLHALVITHTPHINQATNTAHRHTPSQ